jgi:DNA-binding protein YbaB
VSNDALRHQMTEMLALVQEQLADVAAVQKKQAQLTASAAAADGLVEVTVNAHGHVVKTVIDESYLDEYEFEELADHVTEAAQAATREAGRRVSAMLAPIDERRKAFPSLSEIVEGAPDLRDLMPPGLDPFSVAGPRRDAGRDEGGEETVFPTVRR